MAAKFNIFGGVYDDSQPCFADLGNGIVRNRMNNAIFSLESLIQLAIRIGYTWPVGEIEGYPKPKPVKVKKLKPVRSAPVDFEEH